MVEEKKNEPKEEKKNGQEQPSAETSAPQGPVGEGKVIMLVDDDPTSLELIRNILEKAGFQVVANKTAEEAWGKWTPDVVPNVLVTDVLMEGMGGLGLLKEIKKNKEIERTPILVISERRNMDATFMALGADAFLPKPIDTKKFIDLVAELSKRPVAARKPPSKGAPADAEKKEGEEKKEEAKPEEKKEEKK